MPQDYVDARPARRSGFMVTPGRSHSGGEVRGAFLQSWGLSRDLPERPVNSAVVSTKDPQEKKKRLAPLRARRLESTQQVLSFASAVAVIVHDCGRNRALDSVAGRRSSDG
jgi:hypothetical protein